MARNIKFSITHSFFELQTPDFAWKFIWKVRTNYKKTKWSPKTKWLPNPKTDHNTFNYQPRSIRFCMVVHIDLLQITHFGKQNCHQKQNGHQITKLIITHSIFKLDAPDFAWGASYFNKWMEGGATFFSRQTFAHTRK